MSLLLDLFSLRPVDETDKGNITASYVAAAFGNERSLKALLGRNANVNFIRLGPKFINETVDMLHFCKNYAFWEYSLLNIAAQNGHFETVITLLRHNADISHQTSFGSNSFLLAVENGHTRLVRYFILLFKSNFITSLNQALYISAKNGYVDIVDLLLYHGAEDSCPSCNSSQYWTSFHQTRLQAINSGENLQRFNFAFLDDGRFVRCESVLEIAIQNGHTEIVQHLLQNSSKTSCCREAGGRTPVFTALKFKRTEIFKILIQKGINKQDRCLYRKRRAIAIDLNEREREEYLENMCPYNVTISHYLAYNWDKEIFDIGQSYNLWNWTAKDSNGATPVHYACCAGNSGMVDLLERSGTNFDVRSTNGSTPLHSAAICRRNSVLSYLLFRNPKSVFDNQNKSLSHYVAMSVRFYNETTKDIINNDEYLIIYLEKKLHEEVLLKDNHNKTPLHYACESGNVNLFNFYLKFSKNFSSIIESFNNEDISFLDYAFLSIPVFDKNEAKSVEKCNVYILFSEVDCDYHRLNVFVPHEYMIFLILKSTFSLARISQNIGKYVNISLQKNSPHLLGIVFFNFPHQYMQYMDRYGVTALKNLFKHPKINTEIFLFLPDMNYDCSKITNEAVLHDIFQDKKRTFWASRYFDISKFKVLTKSLDSCVDAYGFNFLQRSVIGGNYKAFQYLRNLGMSCYIKTRDGRNLIQLLVDSAPCFEEENNRWEFFISRPKNWNVQEFFNDINSFTYSYNEIALDLVRNTNIISDMKLHEVCNTNSKSLSFSHKVAGKGLIDVLLEIGNQFGSHALNCVNKNNISTELLLQFFNHFNKFPSHVRLLHASDNINLTASLFLKILLDFKPFVLPKFSIERKCQYRMKNHRNIRSMGICVIQSIKESLRLLQQYIKSSGIKSKSDFEKLTKTSHDYQSRRSAKTCSNNFVNNLASIEKLNEHPKTHLKLTCFIYDRILKRIQMNGCLDKYRSPKEVNSTECCELISLLIKTRAIFKDLYSMLKSRKMFILFSLYQHNLNIPFKQDTPVPGKLVGLEDIYAQQVLALYELTPEFHMQKKYNFWDWFKSCKNCLAKDMIRRISSSSVRDIQKWKGSSGKSFMPFYYYPAYMSKYESEETKSPLYEYYLLLENAGDI